MISLLLSSTDPAGQRLRRQIAIVLTISLSMVIAALTLLPISGALNIPGSDKLHHQLAFAALMFPCAFVYSKSLPWLLPLALGFGAAIEMIQPSVGRAGEWADFLADALGTIAGTVLGFTLRVTLKKILDPKPALTTLV